MTRSGIAAGLVLALPMGACALDGRTALGASYGALLAANDRDGDGLLGREEVTAMVAAAFPPERRTATGWERVRARLVADFMAKDTDGDGRLSLSELGRGEDAGASPPGDRLRKAVLPGPAGDR